MADVDGNKIKDAVFIKNSQRSSGSWTLIAK